MLPFFFCEKERQIRKHTYICLDLQNNNSNKKEKPENNEAGCLQGMEVGEENEKDTGENDTSLSTPFFVQFSLLETLLFYKFKRFKCCQYEWEEWGLKLKAN